jgi:hypothetical protein
MKHKDRTWHNVREKRRPENFWIAYIQGTFRMTSLILIEITRIDGDQSMKETIIHPIK